MPSVPQGGGAKAAPPVLQCVVNVSEGRDAAALGELADAAGRWLLDVHSDPWHHRSVFTLAGAPEELLVAVKGLAVASIAHVDLRRHTGAHPRFGVLDVVPWVALEGWPLRDATPVLALRARDNFAAWAASTLGLPVFLYGPERSLPEVRRRAWRSLAPDLGPQRPHPSGGSTAVGQRRLMVAYNLWTGLSDLEEAKRVADSLRSAAVRALAFSLGGQVQVSCNLLDPLAVGPAEVYDRVAALAPVRRAELVGLLPAEVLNGIPEQRWEPLDLSPERTVEARWAQKALG